MIADCLGGFVSRIGVVEHPGASQVSIVIDADAATDIFTYDLEHLTGDERHQLLDMGPALPYRVRPGAKTLIIGPGGGWDVARAWTAGKMSSRAAPPGSIRGKQVKPSGSRPWRNKSRTDRRARAGSKEFAVLCPAPGTYVHDR